MLISGLNGIIDTCFFEVEVVSGINPLFHELYFTSIFQIDVH